jgi:hypothetical protein
VVTGRLLVGLVPVVVFAAEALGVGECVAATFGVLLVGEGADSRGGGGGDNVGGGGGGVGVGDFGGNGKSSSVRDGLWYV